MRHELKTWPIFFQSSWAGAKSFEIRKNDRDFKMHDEVLLMEYNQDTGEYSGRMISGFITYISDFMLPQGYVAFEISESSRTTDA